MISVRSAFIIAVVGSFTAGSFVASPGLIPAALAVVLNEPNTVNSAAIINGEVKNADLGANAVTTSKINDGAVKSADIADGSVTYADLSKSVVKVEHRNDCNCGGTGWDPDGTSNTEIIYDDRITPNSAIVVTGIFAPTNYSCVIEDPASGSVSFACAAPIPEGFAINYAIFNPQ